MRSWKTTKLPDFHRPHGMMAILYVAVATGLNTWGFKTFADDPPPIVNSVAAQWISPIDRFQISNATKPYQVNGNGLVVHTVRSPFQAGVTQLKVLQPNVEPPSDLFYLVLVLPVEPQTSGRWGDALSEIRRLDLHNRLGAVFVEPTFAAIPWYADHPTDLELRQESFLIEAVLPSLSWLYPNARHDRDGRLLVGFSKSGNGAWTLLLRHPQLFGRAAAWDAPLSLSAPDRFGSGQIYGTQENFQRYYIPDLLRTAKPFLTQTPQSALPRLIHAGYDAFQVDHEAIETQLNELGIAHRYLAGPKRKHHWNSGWLEPVLQELCAK